MTFLRIHRQEGDIFGRIGESVKKITNPFSVEKGRGLAKSAPHRHLHEVIQFLASEPFPSHELGSDASWMFFL
ncbi:hypothetical protein HNP81_002051 [Peribacillus huizhouensis]|uniref:Uncharacterized protein n=1 Tax=Peribacillus huizhouensis TaxID=1501239 RepID=A0ABR6CPY8_9BACI|nr:hypothetical protein [Peribacillus huizhouensis]